MAPPRVLVGSVNPRTCEASVLAHLMRAFSDVEGVYADVEHDEHGNDLVVFYVNADTAATERAVEVEGWAEPAGVAE